MDFNQPDPAPGEHAPTVDYHAGVPLMTQEEHRHYLDQVEQHRSIRPAGAARKHGGQRTVMAGLHCVSARSFAPPPSQALNRTPPP